MILIMFIGGCKECHLREGDNDNDFKSEYMNVWTYYVCLCLMYLHSDMCVVYVCVHTCVHVFVYVCVFVCVHVSVCVCVYV